MTATTTEKQSAATLKIELRGGKRVYKLAAKERTKLVNAANLCSDLGTVSELLDLCDVARKALDDVLAKFPVDE